jgi:hypothetical protein
VALTAVPTVADSDQRDALAQLWTGIYDISEELVAGSEEDSPLAAVTERVQINVRRVTLPWLGTHVLYVEEYPSTGRSKRSGGVVDRACAATEITAVRQFTRNDG